MSGESTGDTEIAFCPWSGGPLSYLGLTGKSAWLDVWGYCQTDKLGRAQYSDDNLLNWNDLDSGRFLTPGKFYFNFLTKISNQTKPNQSIGSGGFSYFKGIFEV